MKGMYTIAAADQQAAGALNTDIRALMLHAVRLSLSNPRLLPFLVTAGMHQRRAIRRREMLFTQGTPVPAFLIISVTAQCNLRCAGCYSASLHAPQHGQMDPVTLRTVLGQARDLGVGMTLISGGEPFSYPGLLDILGTYPELLMPVFTNGQLLGPEQIHRLRACRHVIPIISLEGGALATDARRGTGVYARAVTAIENLTRAHVLSGVSVTVTRQNFDAVFSRAFVREAVARGSRLLFFVEYIPADEDSAGLVPTPDQAQQVPALLTGLRKEFPALLFGFPYEEPTYGGCLASGRGFVHINAAGGVEPCPFAPYSDTNVVTAGLKAALDSRLLRVIRENHGKLSETAGGCALWANREWVRRIAEEHAGADTHCGAARGAGMPAAGREDGT